MNDDEDLVLNAKAIGLAVGGAALAGLLFVLTRRDEQPAPVIDLPEPDEVKDAFEREARQAVSDARKHRKSVAGAFQREKERLEDVAETARVDTEMVERDLKAAAWDAQERARLAESKLRAASSKVAEDAAHIASRVGAEARHLADEGKGRISHLRRPGEADAELERLKAELESLRAELAGKAKPERKEFRGIASKLGGKKVGPLPEGVAGEAANAALLHLEKSLKTKAPMLLTARNKAQAMEILQREIGPTLRETAMLALSTALSGAESAGQKAAAAPHDLKQRLRHEAHEDAAPDDLQDRLRAAREEAAAEAQQARKAAEAEARAAREEADRLKAELEAKLQEMAEAARNNGKHGLWSRHKDDPQPVEPEAVLETEMVQAGEEAESGGKRGVSGLLWGGAGLGLALYAMMDPERRENMLKMANEASVQMQELVRDLQGYDDEF